MRRTTPFLVLACALALAPTATASTGTQPYSAPGEHPFVVPGGVTSVQVVLVGANGGFGTGNGGGVGATLGATLAVMPGQTLFAEVGGNGDNAINGNAGAAGGLGGGGVGGARVFLFAGGAGGGGGGGASDVRTCSTSAANCPGGSPPLATRLAVAGGGGGGGGMGGDVQAPGVIPGGAGGSGGGPGAPGGPDAHGDLGGGAGQQGNQASGGAAGGNSSEAAATAGELGKGGNGGTAPAGGGGGGGGGLYGGGGAGAGLTTEVDPNKFLVATAGGGGGGGGSSGVPAGATGVSDVGIQQTQAGGASVTFTWTEPAPAVSTTAATSIKSSTAALNGTVNPNDSALTGCHFEVTPAPPAGANVPCAQQVGGGSSPVKVSAEATALRAGTTYRYRLVASSAAGSSSGDQVAFTAGVGGLRLTSFRLTPSRFRAAARKGTTIAFSVSESSRVTVTFQRAKGRRYVKVRGKLQLKATAGKRRVRFLGKLGGRRLVPGTYRVSAVATSAGRTSAVRRARATVLR